MERSKTDEIVDAIINGHAFDKHLSEFDNPHLGQPLNINTKEELGEHLKNVLESNETLCFNGFVNTPKSEADFYYHDPSNTAIVVPSNNNDEPTSYRPKEYLDNFIVKLNQAIEKDGAITICNGIQELHPEYYQNVEKNVSVQEVQPSEQSQEPQAKKLM